MLYKKIKASQNNILALRALADGTIVLWEAKSSHILSLQDLVEGVDNRGALGA